MDTRRTISCKENYLQLQALHSPRRQDSSAPNGRSANRTCCFIIRFHPHWFGLLDLSAQKTTVENCRRRMLPLFVCFSTKAVHMETVTTLAKEDCLDAIKRFTARHGLPENIYSDNSRTFIGTRGEIEFRKLLMDREFKGLVDAFTTGQQIN